MKLNRAFSRAIEATKVRRPCSREQGKHEKASPYFRKEKEKGI